MKLVDILVKHLDSWPCGCVAIHQDYDREVWACKAYDKPPRILGRFPELAEEHRAFGELETSAIMVTELMYNMVRGVQQDDPLPPAPESVRYYTSPGKMNYLDIHIDTYDELCIAATSDRDTFYNYLDADAALQLAHDLNRMANEIKRWERAQSGE